MTARINEWRYEGKDGTGEGFVLKVRRRADPKEDEAYAVGFGYAEGGWRDPVHIALWLSEEQVRMLARTMLDAVGRDGE